MPLNEEMLIYSVLRIYTNLDTEKFAIYTRDHPIRDCVPLKMDHIDEAPDSDYLSEYEVSVP